MSAASAATGASEVPADTTATVPRGTGSGPRVTARATSSTTASGSASSTASTRLVGEPGGQHGPVRVRGVQGAEDLDDLLRGLAGAVHDLGVAGAGRAVGVEPRVSPSGVMPSCVMPGNL